MPRRKYGHMVGACPPTKKEKCRICRMGKPCPIHRGEADKPSNLRGGKLKHLQRKR